MLQLRQTALKDTKTIFFLFHVYLFLKHPSWTFNILPHIYWMNKHPIWSIRLQKVNNYIVTRFHSLIVQSVIFWFLPPLHLVQGHQCFGKTCCLHFQGLNELVEDAFTWYKLCVLWPGTLNQNYPQQGQFPYWTRRTVQKLPKQLWHQLLIM